MTRWSQLYFADLSRETTNYVLVTECIPYGGVDPRSGLQLMPKCGKYQDDRLGAAAAEYYYALMVAFARIAAADKQVSRGASAAPTPGWCALAPRARADRGRPPLPQGRFEAVMDSFVASGSGGPAASPLPDTPARRQMAQGWAATQLDALDEFATVVAPNLFPRELCERCTVHRRPRTPAALPPPPSARPAPPPA